jgi:4-amino-4-deoxy-L-arabinose transferase-like glycosyltransferase
MIRRPLFSILLFLFLAVVGRALLLEHTALIDPTEARYASVAQTMVVTGDWITPMLPMEGGMQPYMSKPPLHYWITALAYTFLGVDEWTSRIPSFIATLSILFTLFIFTRKRFGEPQALGASLVYFSSGMVFFLAGASVTDVTLTLMITLSTIFLYLFIAEPTQKKYLALISAVFAGLGFLVKGPVSLILIGLPVLLWSAFRRDFNWVKKFPWFLALLTFTLVAGPWFILCEIKNPGFLKYFFWNENIARYLYKNYGDKYGNGHLHTYGTSWIMLSWAFLPWTPLLLLAAVNTGKAKFQHLVRAQPDFLFVFCWSFSTPVFLTFVKNIHAMYILPALPPLSILLSVMLLNENARMVPPALAGLAMRFQSSQLGAILSCLVLALGIMGAFFGFSFYTVLMCLSILGTVLLLLKFTKLENSRLQGLSRLALFFFCFDLVLIMNITPYVNEHRSAVKLLKEIALSKGCTENNNPHQVGVSTNNSFSHYWVAGAWEKELSEQVDMKYVSAESASSSDVCFYMIKVKKLEQVPQQIIDHFTLFRKTGEWFVYTRIPKVQT